MGLTLLFLLMEQQVLEKHTRKKEKECRLQKAKNIFYSNILLTNMETEHPR